MIWIRKVLHWKSFIIFISNAHLKTHYIGQNIRCYKYLDLFGYLKSACKMAFNTSNVIYILDNQKAIISRSFFWDYEIITQVHCKWGTVLISLKFVEWQGILLLYLLSHLSIPWFDLEKWRIYRVIMWLQGCTSIIIYPGTTQGKK